MLASRRFRVLETSMVVTERITMTMREVDRFKVIQDVTEGRLKPWRAAERLGLTTRQIRRLATRYRESGAAGLVSRKRGMPGNRRLDDDLAQRALAIVREQQLVHQDMRQFVRQRFR